MKRFAAAAFLFGILPFHLSYSSNINWFPQESRQAMMQNIATKLIAIDTEGKLSSENALESGRVVVDDVSAKAELLGVEGLIELAPTYPDFDIPASSNAPLDAIVSYQLCSLPMDAFYNDDSEREHKYDERAWGLFLSASIYVVSAYLRTFYLKTGVTDETAQNLLHSEAMNSLKNRIQSNAELLRYTMTRCSDSLTTLMK